MKITNFFSTFDNNIYNLYLLNGESSQRIIAHFDMDTFFVSVECLSNSIVEG